MKPCSLVRGLILHRNQPAVAFQCVVQKQLTVSFDEVKKTRVGLFLCNQLLLLCTQKTRHLRGDNCARVNVAVPAYAKSKIHTQLPFQTNIPQ